MIKRVKVRTLYKMETSQVVGLPSSSLLIGKFRFISTSYDTNRFGRTFSPNLLCKIKGLQTLNLKWYDKGSICLLMCLPSSFYLLNFSLTLFHHLNCLVLALLLLSSWSLSDVAGSCSRSSNHGGSGAGLTSSWELWYLQVWELRGEPLLLLIHGQHGGPVQDTRQYCYLGPRGRQSPRQVTYYHTWKWNSSR